ncbi:MAG: UDP-glucose/GDP-mannose dehydrogenase family protein [Methanoregula sp.]|nr:UDP-glucose/GDP-mannose dehydrogenase family protein [Methanoregula sp.]
MKLSIIGTGYVGSVTGICFADMGHQICFVDVDQIKLDAINSGKSPIYEPDLDNLLMKNRTKITTTTDIPEAVNQTDLTMICVGTPQKTDGSSDLRFINDAAYSIGKALADKDKKYHTVIVKSTVLPGTTSNVVKPVLERESGKEATVDFGIGANPEFLKEGNAVKDFFHTDRIVIGANDPKTKKTLEGLYKPLHAPIFTTNIKTAEMIKYVSNAFLATKISFSNEIGNLCKVNDIDSYEVFRGVSLDCRINPHFFRSGIGFGGSCFPKDVHALIAFAESQGIDTKILKAVIRTNDDQPQKLIALLKKHLDIRGKKIGILGLSFKPDTDDIRESRAIPVVQALLEEGAQILAYDPMAMPGFKTLFPRISYAKSSKEVLETDALMIITEWKEFFDIDYKGKIVIDGRKVNKARREADIYEGICW